jgi:hypothetical protein
MIRVFLLALFLPMGLLAQSFILNGRVSDSSGVALPGAGVELILGRDTVPLSVMATDVNGKFRFAKLQQGFYRVRIRFIGYSEKTLRVFLKDSLTDLGNITVFEDVRKLSQIDVVRDVTPTLMKGDTTEYNSRAFKTSKDASAEDLVTKMPGVTIQDGKVQAQGEEVKQVLVDGKPFFGDDPTAVLKTLPAEVIDKIQVFDRRSEQSQFTGFDDGNTAKTLNIITKQEYKNGTFGRAAAGYGDAGRYKGNLALNKFKGAQRLTLLGNFNNVNEQNFSSDDLAGVMAGQGGGDGMMSRMRSQFGGMMRGGRGGPGRGGPDMGNPGESFLVDQSGGISTTQAAGFNYSDKKGKADWTLSYFFNRTDNQTGQQSLRTFFQGAQDGSTYDQVQNSNTVNINHRIQLRAEIKIDSLRSILVQPKFSLQENAGDNNLNGNTFLGDLSFSSTSAFTDANTRAWQGSASILFRNGFKLKGRTLSVQVTPTIAANNTQSSLLSLSSFPFGSIAGQNLDQQTQTEKPSWSAPVNITYTEPIGKQQQLSFTLNPSWARRISDKITNNPDSVGAYLLLDTLLSAKLNTFVETRNAGVSWRIGKGGNSFNAGLSAQENRLNIDRVLPTTDTFSRSYFALLPNASLQWRFGLFRNLRVNYRSSASVPSADQLLPALNNTNPLQLTRGNSELNQDLQHHMFIRYSAMNPKKSSALFLVTGFSLIRDYVGTETYQAFRLTVFDDGLVLVPGAQITSPVNMNGYFQWRNFGSYSIPLKAIRCNLTTGGSFLLSYTPGRMNGQNNITQNYTAGALVSLASNISEKVDFTITGSPSWNVIQNKLQPALNNEFYSHVIRLKTQLQPWKGWVLQTELTQNYFQGLSAGLNTNFTLWNAGVGYKFLKDRQADVRLIVFDMLKQNNSLSRNAYETYYEDVQTNTLTRYLMLVFTWNIRYFPPASDKMKVEDPQR